MTRLRFGMAMSGTSLKSPTIPEHARRGGAGSAALTNTLDPSQYPTTPPQSSYKHGVPKIGGSEGGFIGLLVGIIVLFLACCGVVYYLLRTRKHNRTGNKNHPPSSVKADSKGFFSSLPFRNKHGQNTGWEQQGDEFNYDSDEDLAPHKGPAGDLPTLSYGAYGDGGTGYTGQGKQQLSQDTKLAGVPDAYTDPFDPERLPESVRKQQAPLPASTSISSRDPPLYKSYARAPQLTGSPTSPTFEGGTKFKEQF